MFVEVTVPTVKQTETKNLSVLIAPPLINGLWYI